MFDNIFKRIVSYNKNADKKRIKAALEFAENRSKQFDIFEEIIPLKPDDDSIIACILYSLYVEGEINKEEVLKDFGKKVLDILDGVLTLETLKYVGDDKESQLEVFRKMFLTMARDARVVFIALACRLCKMKRIDELIGDAKQKKMLAEETMSVYVPIAGRMGIYRIKTDLEDLSFQHIHPKEFKSIDSQLEKFGKEKKIAINKIQKTLKDFLESHGYEANISGRIKNIASIYRKLSQKFLCSIDDLYDIYAMRIILPTKYNFEAEEQIDHLYTVLGLIHSEWKPISSKFKDYVAVPKPNGYRSLHTVVLGLGPKSLDKPVEIQIRSEAMHNEAEFGMASHWIYKDKSKKNLGEKHMKTQIEWVKELEILRRSMYSDGEVFGKVELEVFKDRIFVLTPKGDIKDLSAGSTPIDFAYRVHTDIGNRCVMAKVNGNTVSLDYELKNGDVVEIITNKDSKPKLQWLSLVKTDVAKTKIRAWFSGQNKENNVKEGRNLVNAQLARLGKSPLDQRYSILKKYAGKKLNLSDREHLLEEVGKGSQLASDIIRNIFPYEEILALRKGKLSPRGAHGKMAMERNKQRKESLKSLVLVGGEPDLPVKLASCCKPKHNDDIVGYVTRGNSITVHKMSCALIDSLDRKRIISAGWKGKESDFNDKYRVDIKLTVSSRVGLIRDITSVISDMGILVVDMKMEDANDPGIHYDCFTLEFDDLDKFDVLMNKLEHILGVKKVVKC